MKVLKKSAVFFFALLIMVLSAVPVFANDVVSPLAKNHPYKDYYIENYDIKINVLENNTLEITEKISVYFNQQRHGIFRKIPLSNRVQRADGSIRMKHRQRAAIMLFRSAILINLCITARITPFPIPMLWERILAKGLTNFILI